MSTPFVNKQFTFTQPDGSRIQVRGTGNQHHATFQSLDGFPVVKDPTSGFFHYASVGPDGTSLSPIGVRVGAVNPALLGLRADVRPNATVVRESIFTAGLKQSPSRWEVRRAQRRHAKVAAMGIGLAPPQRPTVGTFVGLCLLVQFPDESGTITQDEVTKFCNQQGYNGFGNNGSVRDYFFDVSDGKLTYTNVVAPYYTARHSKGYYTDPNIPQPRRARELILEAIAWHQANGFDFSALTVDDKHCVYATNVFYAGPVENNWAEGLWPHSYHLESETPLMAGKLAMDYQITDMSAELSLGTFCHENGHMICDFPDLYDYQGDSYGAGVYCLMCFGGNESPKDPMQIGAYLKHSAGWTSKLVTTAPGSVVTLNAGRNEFALHAKDSEEYFILENRRKSGRDAALPDAGLAVWHVDERGSNSDQQMTAAQHYECALVQADGQNDLEQKVNAGDASDLFRKGQNASLNGASHPNSNWWDGSGSGLKISGIGPAGAAMSFKVDP
jgi:M6 family metalloprotease-like protein